VATDGCFSTELPEVPGYRVISLVAGGSRGAVFRARELETEELVALKVLRNVDVGPVRSALEGAVERLAGVESAVLVKPRKVVETTRPSGLVIVMDCIQGDSLARQLGRSVRLPPGKAVRIAAAVARGLGAAFDAGFVHGALHPGKILASGDAAGARLVGTGLGEALPAAFETPAASGRVAPHVYAADEVLAGDPPSAASDVFSLGAILYHMLTGHEPWDSSSLAALRVARADGPLVWPRGSSDIFPPPAVGLVDRMTLRNPAARPAGGWLLAEALESVLRKRRRVSRRASRVLEEPSPDVAPVETGAAETGTTAPFAGLLHRAREYLARPSAIRVIVGGATAVFLLAVALALRASPDRRPPSERPRPVLAGSRKTPQGRPASIDAAGTETGAVAGADVDATPVDPGVDEIRTIEGLLAENPADAEVFRERLEAIMSERGEVGVRATLLLARMRESGERRAEEAVRRLLDRAAALEAGGRFGQAVAVLEEFPFDRFAGTPAARRARLEADGVRVRAATAFAEVERGTEPLLARGGFAAARSEYEYLRDTIGLPEWVQRAEETIARIGRMEEEAAEAAVERREAEAKTEVAGEVERALAELPQLCRSFRYSKAERTLDGLLAKPLADRDRKRLVAYGRFVRREAEQFRLVGRRIRSGERQGLVGPPGTANRLVIRDVTEEGLELKGVEGDGSLTTRLGWHRITEYKAYKFMVDVGTNLASFDEHLALAIFAHHRELATEAANELGVAGTLAVSRGAKEAVEQVRALLAGEGRARGRQ
jgi:serine/threonine-protein kinase